MYKIILLLLLFILLNINVCLCLKYAKSYGDHMVLQRAPYQSWIRGYGVANSKLTLTISNNHVYEGYVNIDGSFGIQLQAYEAGGPYVINVQDSLNNTITLNDIYFGEVYLCSGQSNMQFTVDQAFNASQEIKNSNHPLIRVFTAAMVESPHILYDLQKVEEQWSVSSPTSIGGGNWTYFSATCYFFGRDLHEYFNYKVPIGLIATDWGGTPIEAWSSPDAIKKCPESNVINNNKLFKAAPHTPSVLWNAMIYPFLNMTIKGAIWYQGEANAGAHADLYACQFPAMITDWREKWHYATKGATDLIFGFGFVQLSTVSQNNKTVGQFPTIRWGQTANFGYVPNSKLQNVYMAVAMDLGDINSPFGDIHPRYKQDVGHRLALSSQAIVYNSNVYYTGPLIVSANHQSNGNIVLTFNNVGEDGIEIRNKNGFELQNSDTADWFETQVISNTQHTVTVFGNSSGNYTNIRYAWRENPCAYKTCSVYAKKEKLPSPPFIIKID